MNQTAHPKADLLLVTVTDIETRTVLTLLEERYGRKPQQLFIGDKTYRDLGVIGGAHTFLVRSEMGAGGLGGAILTVAAGIADLNPAAVIMPGIAFGIDPQRQQIGDILVARQLMLYDLQKVATDSEGGFVLRARGDRPSASPWLLDRFRAGGDDWQGAALHFGLVLSGDKLIDNLDFRDQLLRFEPEAIGGEMEGAGLYVAAQSRKVDWLLVKAICDWADGKKSQNKEENQVLAARNAMAYVFHVIEQGGLVRPGAAPTPATSVAPTPPAAAGAPLSATQLRQLLTERLNLEELRTACFDLGIDPDNLAGDSKSARVRELISYLERRRETARLYEWLHQNRPDIGLS